MRLDVTVKLDLKTTEVQKRVEEAARLGLRDTIVAISNDAIRGSPIKTGNNRRSIVAEVSGLGLVNGDGPAENMVDQTKLESATYSSSGYGGYLETGTYHPTDAEDKARPERSIKMAARPYFRPALDKHKSELIPNIKRYLG